MTIKKIAKKGYELRWRYEYDCPDNPSTTVILAFSGSDHRENCHNPLVLSL